MIEAATDRLTASEANRLRFRRVAPGYYTVEALGYDWAVTQVDGSPRQWYWEGGKSEGGGGGGWLPSRKAAFEALKDYLQHRIYSPKYGWVTESSTISERSFTEKDIPKFFYLQTRLRPEFAKELAAGVLDGVSGIGGNGEIEYEYFGGGRKDVSLVMPGPATVKLNKLSRVMYWNPHYLLANNMAAIQRVMNTGNARGAVDRLGRLLGELFGRTDQQEWGALAHDYEHLNEPRIDTVKDFVKFMHRRTQLRLDTTAKGRYGSYLAFTRSYEKDFAAKMLKWPYAKWVRVLTSVAEMIHANYEAESEWIVKDRKLRVPRGSRIRVAMIGYKDEQSRGIIDKHGLDQLYDVEFVDNAEWEKTKWDKYSDLISRHTSKRKAVVARGVGEDAGNPKKMGKALRKVGFRTMAQAKTAARTRRAQVRLDKLPPQHRKKLLDPHRKDLLNDRADESVSWPEGVYLHGTDQRFDAFKLNARGYGHDAVYFSDANHPYSKRQALAVAKRNGWLVAVRLKPGKHFNPYTDPVADRIRQEHARDSIREFGPEGKRIAYEDAARVIAAAKPHGYNRFSFYERSVQANSEAVTDPRMIEILQWYRVGRGGEVVPVDETTIAEATDGGDCYEAAAKYMMSYGLLGSDLLRAPGVKPNPKLVLVHAEIVGQGAIAGLKYGHAWVEDGEMVIDVSNGRNIRMPKVIYESLANLRRHDSTPPFQPNWHRYTGKQAAAKMVKHRHFGPWDLKTSSGL